MLHGYRVPALPDERGAGNGLIPLNCTLKNDYDGKFYVCFTTITKSPRTGHSFLSEPRAVACSAAWPAGTGAEGQTRGHTTPPTAAGQLLHGEAPPG